jgi:hypothetical protein
LTANNTKYNMLTIDQIYLFYFKNVIKNKRHCFHKHYIWMYCINIIKIYITISYHHQFMSDKHFMRPNAIYFLFFNACRIFLRTYIRCIPKIGYMRMKSLKSIIIVTRMSSFSIQILYILKLSLKCLVFIWI